MKSFSMTLTCAILLVASFVHANDSQISFVTNNWEPYASELLPDYGISSVIIAEACKRANLEPKFSFRPWNRAMAKTREGSFDAIFNAYYSKERAENFAVSKPYFKVQLTLCTTTRHPISYDGTIASLKPYKIGVIRGFVNTPGIDQAEYLDKDEAETDLLNIKKLLARRVQVIVIDKYQALDLLKNNPTIEAGVADIHFVTPLLEEKTLHVLFSKRGKEWKKKLHRFNKGLREIQADGTMNKIMARFGFSVPMYTNQTD